MFLGCNIVTNRLCGQTEIICVDPLSNMSCYVPGDSIWLNHDSWWTVAFIDNE